MNQIGIVIVSYNVAYFLQHCLLSIQKNTLYQQGLVSVVVVDNASTDNTRQLLPQQFPQVKFIWNDTNLGFSKANNLGVKALDSEYYFFLNPDTLIAEDTLEKALKFFQNNATQNIGAIGLRMIDGGGNFLPESMRLKPTIQNAIKKGLGLASTYYQKKLPNTQTQPTEILSGAALIMPSYVFKKIGGWNEDYFLYAEDIDLSIAVADGGYRIYYLADTTIIHFKGESGGKHSAIYNKYFYDTMLIYVDKHFRNKLLNIFLKGGIKLVQAIKKIVVVRKKKTSYKTSFHKTAILTARPQKFEKEMPDIISRNEFKDTVINVSDLTHNFTNHNIIYDTETLPLSNIITHMQQQKNNAFFFSSKESIIGSGSKNITGIIIT